MRINPYFAEAHSNLGVALGRQGGTDETILEFRLALELQPDYPAARRNLHRAETILRRRRANHPDGTQGSPG